MYINKIFQIEKILFHVYLLYLKYNYIIKFLHLLTFKMCYFTNVKINKFDP